jgi:hypothetical protein
VTSDPVQTPPSAGPAPAGAGYVATGPVVGPGSSPAQRPEVLVGAAFAGGLVAALILKRRGS